MLNFNVIKEDGGVVSFDTVADVSSNSTLAVLTNEFLFRNFMDESMVKSVDNYFGDIHPCVVSLNAFNEFLKDKFAGSIAEDSFEDTLEILFFDYRDEELLLDYKDMIESCYNHHIEELQELKAMDSEEWRNDPVWSEYVD